MKLQLLIVGHFHDGCKGICCPLSAGRRWNESPRPGRRCEEGVLSAFRTGRSGVLCSQPVVQTSCMEEVAAGCDFDRVLLLEAV